MKVADVNKRLESALNWIVQSVEATHGKGSSAGFHVFKGWFPAYPETSGYLIPTLISCSQHFQTDKYDHVASQIGDWLLSIQLKNGAYPGGLDPTGKPVIFDTGQILIGLIALYSLFPEKRFLNSIQKTYDWLYLSISDIDLWAENAYVKGYIPAYHTRVIWGMCAAARVLDISNEDWAIDKLKFLLRNYSDEWIPEWSFNQGEAAYTHTIAYTIRGLLECSRVLNNKQIINIADQILARIYKVFHLSGSLAGSFSEGWVGDHSFQCVTGHAQLALCYGIRDSMEPDPRFREMVINLFSEIHRVQVKCILPGIHGGVPGSQPLWGKYHKWEYPNWAAKFYIDLLLFLLRNKGLYLA